jgi:type IV pilus assembly protein PilN
MRVNLLPHREARRRRQRRAFYAGLAAAAGLGLLALLGLGTLLTGQVAEQAARNALLEAGIARLDAQIRDIAGLRTEIAALEARGRDVQLLQRGRNDAVRLLQALGESAPPGLQLQAMRQAGDLVEITGTAGSSDHVAALMRNATTPNSPFDRAELIELRSTAATGDEAAAAPRFQFSLRLVWRPSAEPAAATATAAASR